MFHAKESRNLVTAFGILSLYAVATTAYIFSLSPKLYFLGNKQQEALVRSIQLESRLREVSGFLDEQDTFSVELRQDTQDPAVTRAYVKRTSNAYPFATVTDVYLTHPHPVELRGESLFVLRKILAEGQDASEELWRYAITGEGVKLYAGKDMTFRASPQGTYLALVEGGTFVVLNRKGEEMQNLTVPQLAGESALQVQTMIEEEGLHPIVSLEGWSSNESMFWGRVQWKGSTVLFRVDPLSGDLVAYNPTSLQGAEETALHPTTGKVLYALSGELHVLDLLQNTDVLIASSVRHTFHPRWIDRETVEYDDAEKKGERITQKLS
ncbi:hypothetical protein COU76_05085 [Candidatus Peregrinibacteria bacterium CG10_big_fil_rev_8_21_14_0_10_49_10]|nr:MAG: hypothetical protein COU76_05085 [Candidatus Peregrinibacteria bacterium CG10_big_fil_rev_8_21_14_0_10_49_10]